MLTFVRLSSPQAGASPANREAYEQITMEAVRHHFPPEFINRLDNVVVFNRLALHDMPAIVDIQLNGVRRLLDERRCVGVHVW